MVPAASSETDPAPNFADRLLLWWDADGRKDLPWQRERTAYRVWVSEIMLQQTQVATVIPYFERFVARFPTAGELANATIDDVLHHWTGLGYYARGRNLHRAAQLIVERFAGVVPTAPERLMSLPGIGRSTAHAIHALAADGRSAILDGNVKRVLARWRGIEGWPGLPEVLVRLWRLSGELLPDARMAEYTQAVMDLGATLCTRSKPRCDACPLASDCVALRTHKTTSLPTAKPRRALPLRRTRMWVLACAEGVLLQQRPPVGIWGGLWSFPESTATADPDVAEVLARLGFAATSPHALKTLAIPEFSHRFTHFELQIQPIFVQLPDAFVAQTGAAEHTPRTWYRSGAQQIGLSAVVTRLLTALQPMLSKSNDATESTDR